MYNIYYISVYDARRKHLGWIDRNGNLTEKREERSGFSERHAADELRWKLEGKYDHWFTEVEE